MNIPVCRNRHVPPVTVTPFGGGGRDLPGVDRGRTHPRDQSEDTVAGPVGVRLSAHDTPSQGTGDFVWVRVVLRVRPAHPDAADEGRTAGRVVRRAWSTCAPVAVKGFVVRPATVSPWWRNGGRRAEPGSRWCRCACRAVGAGAPLGRKPTGTVNRRGGVVTLTRLPWGGGGRSAPGLVTVAVYTTAGRRGTRCGGRFGQFLAGTERPALTNVVVEAECPDRDGIDLKWR